MNLWDVVPFLLIGVKLILIVVSVVFFVSGLDDLFIDVLFLVRRLYRYFRVRPWITPLTLEVLRRKPEQPVAVLIPAWHEAGVIGRMLINALRTIEYRDYHIFVGTYPNDPATQHEVVQVAASASRVHCVVCPHDGPTCKADCLNALYQATVAYEIEHGTRFEIFAMHDAEDWPHRLSLKLFNFLVPRKDLVQLPVLPLPTRWWDFTSGHYIDEFAESHFKNMSVREALSGTVPSAGVGTAFSRGALETLATHNSNQVFNTESLTEDYEIGFRMRRYGLKEIFVLQALPDPVAVRAYFPSTYRAAVNQKSRWILGITMQGWRNIGWTGHFWTDYMLFRDRKTLLTSLANVLGYLAAVPVIAIWVLGKLFVDSYRYPSLVREGSWLYWLIVVDTAFLGLRLFARAWSVYCCYDLKQGLLAIPRQVWGNFINFGAALRAISVFTSSALTGKPIAWGKTDHTFPTENEIASMAPGALSRRRGFQTLSGRARRVGLIGVIVAGSMWPQLAFADGVPTAFPQLTSRLLSALRELRAYAHLDRGYRLLELGQLGEARVEFERHLSVDPGNAKARVAYLVLLYRMKAYDDAIGQANLLSKERDAAHHAWLYGGLALQARGRQEAALDSLQKASSDKRLDDAARQFALANVVDLTFSLRRYDLAVTSLDRLAVFTQDFRVYFRRGEALEALSRQSEALHAYERALGRAQTREDRIRTFVALGEVRRQMHDWNLARDAFEAAFAIDGRTAFMRTIGELSMAAGDYSGAVLWLSRLVAKQPGTAARETLAEALSRLNRFGEAETELRVAIQSAKTHEDRHRLSLAIGHACMQAGNWAKAATAFEDAVEIRPTFGALTALAHALERANQPRLALQNYRAALSAQFHPETALAAGMLETRLGLSVDAIRHLNRAVTGSLSPESKALAYRQLGFLHHDARRFDEARTAFERAIEFMPGDADSYVALGQNALALGDRERELKSLLRAVSIKPSLASRRMLADAYARAGKLPEALAMYRDLTGDSRVPGPDAADAFRAAGTLHFEHQQYPEAAAAFTSAYERSAGSDWESLSRASESHAKAGKWEDVERIARQRLGRRDLSPESQATELERLALAYTKLERPDDAASALRRALELGRDHWQLRLNLGFALFSAGRWTDALADFKVAAAQRPESPADIYIARCYEQLHKPGLAVHHLRRVLGSTHAGSDANKAELLKSAGFLLAAEGQLEEAVDALSSPLLRSDALAQVRLATLYRTLGRLTEAASTIQSAAAFVGDNRLPYLDERADTALAQGDCATAEINLRDALTIATNDARLLKLAGCAAQAGRQTYRIALLERAAALRPANVSVVEALGYAYRQAGRPDAAVDAFRTVLRTYPDRLPLYEEIGYASLEAGRLKDARQWFGNALANGALYPQETAVERKDLARRQTELRRQRRALGANVDAIAFQSLRSDTFPVAVAGVGLGSASAPSFGGVEAVFRASVNAGIWRRLQPITRILWNMRAQSVTFDPDSVRGSIGLRVKPLEKVNFSAGIERVFGVGASAAPGAWLVRGLGSWERGTQLVPGVHRQRYTNIFGDAAYFVTGAQGQMYESQLRHGVSMNVRDAFLITPYALAAGRYLTGLSPHSTSSVEAGIGMSLRVAKLEMLADYRRRIVRSTDDAQTRGWTLTTIFHF